MYNRENLKRAWRWIISNPDYRYKSYFRDFYNSYNLAIDANLNSLKNKLKDQIYTPGLPSKIYAPKKSGILRVYTLLPVEDQIVYQAYVNIIAEAAYEKIRNRYYKTVFSNLYAGKKSIWFYRKWDQGYKSLNRNIKEAYAKGYNFIASFDLTSFYDSIDHQIIRQFLSKMYGFDGDFIDGLVTLLERFSTNIEIFKGNGIPQGPLTSGMLAEIILSYIDTKYDKKLKSEDILYFRYVDDIKLMAKDEIKIKKSLATLDYYCKQIGLYPQSSKIEMHKIENVEDEIKNISIISVEIEQSRKEDNVNHELFSLIKNGHIDNETKFKIYLSNAKHDSRLSLKLIEILPNNLSILENVGRYFDSYDRKISLKVFQSILALIKKPEVFQIINAMLIKSIKENLRNSDYTSLIEFSEKRYKKRHQLNLIPIYKAEILSILIKNQKITYSNIKTILKKEQDFLIIKSVLDNINIEIIGGASYLDLLKICLNKDTKDIAIYAAYKIVEHNLEIDFPVSEINPFAQETLKVAQKIGRISSDESLIPSCLKKICEKNINFDDLNWKSFFGHEHIIAQQRVLIALSYSKTDITAFVNTMDSFNDLLLSKIAFIDSSIGVYQLGNIGGFLSPTSTFKSKYPRVYDMCNSIHNRRKDSVLSHPINKSTHKYTRRIEYKYIYEAKKLIADAYPELISNLPR